MQDVVLVSKNVSKEQNKTQSEFSMDAPTMFSDTINIVTIYRYYPVYVHKTVLKKKQVSLAYY